MAKPHPVLTDPGCHTAEPVETHFFCGFLPQSREGGRSLVCCSFVCSTACLGPATGMAYCAELCETQALGSLGSYPALTEPPEFV